ncbi:hypothetical protein [Ramlibacter sp. WS9]|uniref:hypothetical protein n=1 Tax=Ramlibacter sp. WS9 TaxID=1882741 RepID=UPI0011442051|nr:hypothetical protein [Ramlibacter sp. WS9]ROZ66725.1 hypothetical protein EEB15_25675 [Ramlibacter sp. WS9]
MTTLVYGSHSANHAGASRLTAGLAILASFFKNWASVARDLDQAGFDAKLSARAQRLLRVGY